MITMKYTYPLPNDGPGYSFTEQELVKLLDSVYERGFEDGVQFTNIGETTYTTTSRELKI